MRQVYIGLAEESVLLKILERGETDKNAYCKEFMSQKFNINDTVNVTVPGMEPFVGTITEVQGYSEEGAIFSPDYPIVVGWQYIIEGMAFDEQYLELGSM